MYQIKIIILTIFLEWKVISIYSTIQQREEGTETGRFDDCLKAYFINFLIQRELKM
jgi:hypothetical protein